jgi:hypothetical protein
MNYEKPLLRERACNVPNGRPNASPIASVVLDQVRRFQLRAFCPLLNTAVRRRTGQDIESKKPVQVLLLENNLIALLESADNFGDGAVRQADFYRNLP